MISVVIPTVKEENLKKCLESIEKYTDMDRIRVIAVCNGMKDTAWIPKWVLQLNYDKMLGYPKAVNRGIEAAGKDDVILLNDDAELLPQPKNQWLDMLTAPLSDPKVGMTGPIMCQGSFVVFFCVYIRRALIDAIGMLDENFGVGAGEDADYYIRATKAGWKSKQVPWDENLDFSTGIGVGPFPIYHKGESTVHDRSYVKNWVENCNKNCDYLNSKHKLDGYLTTKYNIPKQEEGICDKAVVVQLLQRVMSDILKETKTSINVNYSIEESGESITVQSHQDSLSTILMVIKRIIELRIFNLLTHLLTHGSITENMNLEMVSGGNVVSYVEKLREYLLDIIQRKNGNQEKSSLCCVSDAALKIMLTASNGRNWQITQSLWHKYPLKLNLGCGPKKCHLPGYTNIDLHDPDADLNMDAADLSRFADNSVAEILASHLIEHFSPYKVPDVLKEWHRVLAPGGKLVLELPDLYECCKEIVKSLDAKDGRHWVYLACLYGAEFDKNMNHMFGYSFDMMVQYLGHTGFRNMTLWPQQIWHQGANMRIESVK